MGQLTLGFFRFFIGFDLAGLFNQLEGVHIGQHLRADQQKDQSFGGDILIPG